MTRPANEDPREVLARLEAQAEQEDEAMQRAIAALRDMIDDREAIESLQQRARQVTMARTGYIIELIGALTERENNRKIVELFRHRRPVLRVVH